MKRKKKYRPSVRSRSSDRNVLNIFVICSMLLLVFGLVLIVTNLNKVEILFSNAQSITYQPGQVPGCQFQKADPGFNVAFCDTFDQPMGTGNRSGDLDGTVWGASRLSDGWNQGQGQYNLWYPNTLDKCGTMVTVTAVNDIQICNGEMVETTSNDGGEGGEVSLNMYPKQPFDIAGRTGTVTFDVTADSQGPHAAWPTFFYTDQPVPAPIADTPPNTAGSNARNSFGFALDGYGNTADNQFIDNCPNDNDTSVGEMFVTRNYVLSHIPFTVLGCVKRPNVAGSQLNSDTSKLGSPLNHFEVRISQSTVTVWGTDPGSTTLKELAVANNVNLPLTRGLIWMEDVRYNANKFNDQAVHTFGWDNVGFDGPVLPRDSANDVNDVHSTGNLGWGMWNTGSLSVPNVTGVEQATGALLTMNWFPNNNTVGSFQYRLNGNAWHTVPYPYGSNTAWSPRTLGISVPLSEVVDGTNKIDFDFTGVTGAMVANVDLITVGGQGIPTCWDPSNCAATQYGTAVTGTPTIAATNTPFPTDMPTVTPVPTSRPTVTNVPTVTPINTTNGLIGMYFSNKKLSGATTLTRIDGTINYNWRSGSPSLALPADHFSVRWEGFVLPRTTERYTFYTSSDDGVRLWVNNQEIINNWTDHAAMTNKGKISLTAGQKYSIRMEYYEDAGLAVARLYWSTPSIAKQIIPTINLSTQ